MKIKFEKFAQNIKRFSCTPEKKIIGVYLEVKKKVCMKNEELSPFDKELGMSQDRVTKNLYF